MTADKLKSFFLVFILMFVSQPVFASAPPCPEKNHDAHETSDMGQDHMMAMGLHEHVAEMATDSEEQPDCCGQVNCELMHCSAFTGVITASRFSIDLIHSGVDPIDSLVPAAADLSVSLRPPIFR